MLVIRSLMTVSFFFFNDTATTEIYTLSLHDALPDLEPTGTRAVGRVRTRSPPWAATMLVARRTDRKSTRLNSSHSQISYAVFCLKKKTRYLNEWEPGRHPPRGPTTENVAIQRRAFSG